MTQQTLSLLDGRTMPALGFGTYKMPPADAERLTGTAIETGYRLVDTAAFYGNEAEVAAGVAGRDDVFLTTKLWRDDMGHDAALRGLDASLRRMGRDSVDLYLIHWPMPSAGLYVETWKALVRAREEGKARSIGVSNFTPEHIEAVADATGVLPVVNQIELHPRFQQREARAFHERHGIVTQSWSPLGQGELLGDPTVTTIAREVGRSAAQVILRWHVQHELSVIPKASSPDRIAENAALYDWSLSEAQMAQLDALDSPQGRIGPDPTTF